MTAPSASTLRTVALVGNPNTGKTTLFNAITGLNREVGNYAGVTVESISGKMELSDGEQLAILDLPGTYSLSAQSPDQIISVNALLGEIETLTQPDVVVAVLDAANLHRNMYLVSQLIETELPLVLALNMIDLAERRRIGIDAETLSARLGIPVVKVSAKLASGIEGLVATVADVLRGERDAVPLAGPVLPDALLTQVENITADARLRTVRNRPLTRAEALRALIDIEGHVERDLIEHVGSGFSDELRRMRAAIGESGTLSAMESELRYRWIENLTRNVVSKPAALLDRRSDKIDRVLTHQLSGFLVLIVVSSLVFQAIYSWSAPLMDYIDAAFGTLGASVGDSLDAGPLRSLLVDGVVAGVGSVLIFLPQIAILFLFISLLEDCGYMARAALLLDRLLTRCGLSGKSFIPLLSSFACAVPAIMAARTIEDRRDRFTTILVAPLMSCSARLPVYIILVAAFIPDQPLLGSWFSLQGFTLFAMYFVGTAVAIPVAWILKKTLLKGESPPFLMELPSYKWPRPQIVYRRVFGNCREFVVRAGSIILAATIVMWALAYFPRSEQTIERYQLERDRLSSEISDLEMRGQALSNLDQAEAGELLRESFLGRAGRLIEPVVRPLGWDWRIGMATLAAFPAREVVISVLGTIFSLGGDHDETSDDLRHAMQAATWEDGTAIFTVPTALSIMVFFALCAQCMSTLAVIQRETGSWGMAGLTFGYMTALAYLGALITYQATNALGWG